MKRVQKQTAFVNMEANEANVTINESRHNKVIQHTVTLGDGDEYVMKKSKSMVSVESDDDEDDDERNDLESHYSVQAVVSYSDSSVSLTKENKEDEDDTPRSVDRFSMDSKICNSL